MKIKKQWIYLSNIQAHIRSVEIKCSDKSMVLLGIGCPSAQPYRVTIEYTYNYIICSYVVCIGFESIFPAISSMQLVRYMASLHFICTT